MNTTRALLAAAVVLALGSPASAAVLCTKPKKDGTFNGPVKIEETCKDKETQLSAYASFSNDSGSAYNVTISGVSIDFFDTAVANHISITTPVVTLPDAGTYRISYCIRTTANSSASSRLVINGSAINASIITPVSQTDKWCRTTMLSLISANSTVQVQLFGTLAPVTLIAPGGADLQIEKLN